MGTKTRSFGTSKRESHDSSEFYNLRLQSTLTLTELDALIKRRQPRKSIFAGDETWINQIYCKSAQWMTEIPDEKIALAFTSPPYNVGKDYDQDLSFEEYLELILEVAQEVYRVLMPGGRYVINIANLGRKPYIPLHAYFHLLHTAIGFESAGEIIWQKGKGMQGNCAWGSWLSAKAPRLRDLHEYLLVFVKDDFSRKESGISNISKEEFMQGTLSIWEIPPESAKRIGHPAPFPVQLAERVLRLFSYENDIILDPFLGSGTTAVAALEANRRYVGYEISKEYYELAKRRIVIAE